MEEEKKVKLLIVDDEEDFRFLISHRFGKLGYEVLEAGDGREALKRYAEYGGDVQLVMTDIRMPEMGGEELIRELRKRNERLPIIGITAHADLKGKIHLLDTGAYYFLDKPIPTEYWPFVDRMVKNAIRLHQRELEVVTYRDTERNIARMLRNYILQRPLEQPQLQAQVALSPVPSHKPSGDYVECFHRNRNELLFYLADATGHKDLLPAFTACLSNMVLHRVHHGRQPTVKEIIYEIDLALDSLRKVDAFTDNHSLTFFIGCVDLTSGELSYVNAGHLPLLRLRRNGEKTEIKRLESHCLAVGQIALFNQNDQHIEQKREALQADDLLFLYSDGVTDSLRESEEESDQSTACIERLEKLVEPLSAKSAQEVVDRVMEHLEERVGESGFNDDTTLLAIRLQSADGKVG